MLTIVVYHCSLLFLAFLILIVLIVRTLYSLFRAPIVCPLAIVSNCSHSFCAVCSTTLYCSMCRTIDQTCISSILCTPWFTSSLKLCSRLVVVSLNDTSSLKLRSRYHTLLTCLTLKPLCSYTPPL